MKNKNNNNKSQGLGKQSEEREKIGLTNSEHLLTTIHVLKESYL